MLALLADAVMGRIERWVTPRGLGDGLADFQKWYGFSFKKAVPMDVGLMYRAVAEHQAEVAMAYATDGRIKQLDLVALQG